MSEKRKNDKDKPNIAVKPSAPKKINRPRPHIDTAEDTFDSPDGHSVKSSDCGDTIEFFLTVKGGVVSDIQFKINGCTNTLACARAAALLARKKSLREARKATTPAEIDAFLGGLPEANKHCAELASEAIAEALTDAAISSREPWRKLYRKI